MQRTMLPPTVRVINRETPRGTVISAELVAYVALFTLALAFRLVALDSVPLMASETPQALAAWRAASPMSSGEPLVPQSSLLFVLQTVSFAVVGGSEFAARLATALAGAFVVVSPALFSGLLGRGRALILSLLLLCSPVLLIASRFSGAAVWSLLLAVLVFWGMWRWSATRQTAYALTAFVMAGGLIFLSEPGGPVLALILALTWLVARALTPAELRLSARHGSALDENSYDFDDEPETPASTPATLPWKTGLAVAALVVVVISTGFMLYPAGLSAVGETLAGTLRGFTAGSSTPFLAFIVSIFTEPFMWVLGIAAVILMARRGELGFIDRFFAAWVLLGAAASLLFGGSSADHALWTTIPLTGLVSSLALDLLKADHRPDSWSVPAWARGVMALVTLALLAIFTMALHMLARSLSQSFDGTLAGVQFVQSSIILLFIPVVFQIVIYLMAVNLWNSRTGLRGITLGVLIFALVTSLGSGWVASVTAARDPLVPYHLRTAGSDAFLLRQTLFDVADRQSNGFSSMPLTVQASEDGVVAWAVRDFSNARFVDDVNEARGEGVVITTDAAVPDLGGSYVGQDFITERSFNLQALTALDLLSWWTQRKVGTVATNSIVPTTIYLWLRQDVYDGVTDELQAGG